MARHWPQCRLVSLIAFCRDPTARHEVDVGRPGKLRSSGTRLLRVFIPFRGLEGRDDGLANCGCGHPALRPWRKPIYHRAQAPAGSALLPTPFFAPAKSMERVPAQKTATSAPSGFPPTTLPFVDNTDDGYPLKAHK